MKGFKMRQLSNYRILQRNADGYAHVELEGQIPDKISDCERVFCMACREDDNLIIFNWAKCRFENKIWSIGFDLPEGGLYRIEIVAGDSKTQPQFCRRIKVISHIGVGDIYIMAGQSNMSGYGRDSAYDPPELGVHLFANNGSWTVAAHPLSDPTDTIYPENAEDHSQTSPALSFARSLKRHLGIPIGLVPAALGGSPLSAWHPEENGYLYRSMKRRIDDIGDFKGFIWYQGCADCAPRYADRYLDRFKRMVRLWRDDLGKNHCFITVQLNQWAGGPRDLATDRCWGLVREAQRRAAKEIPGVYVVPSSDMALNDGIHNSSGSNVMIGERMANTALKNIYGKNGQDAPDVVSVTRIDCSHIFVKYTTDTFIFPMDGLALGVNVEDEHGLIECTQTVCKGDGLLITTARPFVLPANFHSMWRCILPSFIPRSMNGLPVLSCYNVEISENNESETQTDLK